MTESTKPHLVLIPGLMNDARLWRDQVADLADVAQPVVADITGADSIAALAASVLAKAPAGRFALAGLSMGGYVALEIMRQAPERILALALLDTSARADTAEATENRRKLIAMAEVDFPAVNEVLLPKMVHPSHLEVASIVDVITAMAMDVGKDGFLRQITAIMGRIDSRPFLHEITCPTMVLCGREDVVTPVAIHEEIVAGIAKASLTIIEECGHLSPLGQPGEVSAAMRKWLMGI